MSIFAEQRPAGIGYYKGPSTQFGPRCVIGPSFAPLAAINSRGARLAGLTHPQTSSALQKNGKWPEESNQTNSSCGALIVWLYSQIKEGGQY